jgi:hypothetical protein
MFFGMEVLLFVVQDELEVDDKPSAAVSLI